MMQPKLSNRPEAGTEGKVEETVNLGVDEDGKKGHGRIGGRSSLAGRTPPARSCRDNLQQPVAPRRQGSRVPSLKRAGVFGSPPLCAMPTLVREYLLDTSGS